MDLKFLLAQILAIAGAVLYFLSYQCRDNRKLYIMQFFFLFSLYRAFFDFRSNDRWFKLHIEYCKVIVSGKQMAGCPQ